MCLVVSLLLLFALMLFNFAGSGLPGGTLGLRAAFIFFLIVFNQRLFKWWKSVLCVFLVGIMMFVATNSMWIPKIQSYWKDTDAEIYVNEETEYTMPGSVKPYIDYMYAEDYSIYMSLNGNELVFTVEFDGETGTLNVFSVNILIYKVCIKEDF